MKVWGELEHGDVLQDGDEMLGGIRQKWEPIPDTWHGNTLDRHDDITINRMNFKFRRRLKDMMNNNLLHEEILEFMKRWQDLDDEQRWKQLRHIVNRTVINKRAYAKHDKCEYCCGTGTTQVNNQDECVHCKGTGKK